MNLKELRLSLGLNQKECSEYLKMSVRNYQIYETDIKKENTSKYKTLLNKLKAYKLDLDENKNEFYTNIVRGNDVKLLASSVLNFKKRSCFEKLKKFIYEILPGKICALYGLRRTGKTTLLFQMINELPENETAYIKITSNDNMSLLVKDLNTLRRLGYKYIFIDEITLMPDFINTSAVLSDIFSFFGMKIIISGTDSLGIINASNNELYDRCIMIHTSYISFKEYSKLLNIKSIDQYIEYGGTLKKENMSFDDSAFENDEVSFKDDDATRKYIDTAISRNIQNTLKNDHFGKYFNELTVLYEKNELTNVINRLIEDINHKFLISVIKEKFKSHDLGSSKELLLHDYPLDRSTVLYEINEEEVIDRLKKLINIKEKEELSINVTEEHINKIIKLLQYLDLLVPAYEYYDTKTQSLIYLISQPGMRYSITKALVYSLIQDEYFINISEVDKQYIINKILNDVKGRMLEDIVLLEKIKYSSKDELVFKFKFSFGGEIDMVIYNSKENTCSLYEIKHSDKLSANQYRHLIDEEKCKIIESKFGKITGKYVLYRGKNCIVDDITYLNVEDYLCKS